MINNFCSFIVCFLISFPLILFADTNQEVSGNNNSNFSDIKGNISINYNSFDKNLFTQKNAESIVKKYNQDKDIDVEYMEWIDINNGSNINALFINYKLITSNADISSYFSDLYIINDRKESRIFHDSTNEYSGLKKIIIGNYNKKDYIFIYSLDGNAGIIYGSIYELDEINQLRKLYTLEDKYNLPYASIYVINRKIIIGTPDISYILDSDGDKILLKEYKSEIKYPDLGYDKHIMEVEDCDAKEFKLDNVNIDKKILNTDDVAKEINVGDEILIIAKKKIEKVLISGEKGDEMEFLESVQTNIKAKEKGIAEISIYCLENSLSYDITLKIQ